MYAVFNLKIEIRKQEGVKVCICNGLCMCEYIFVVGSYFRRAAHMQYSSNALISCVFSIVYISHSTFAVGIRERELICIAVM